MDVGAEGTGNTNFWTDKVFSTKNFFYHMPVGWGISWPSIRLNAHVTLDLNPALKGVG